MIYDKKPINALKQPMGNDYLELEYAEGMPGLVDSTIALNLLIGAKSGIRNCAMAITEIANTEARIKIRELITSQINLHAEISELMITKGWFHPYEVSEQFKIDEMSAQSALKIANLNLFPGDTSRLGTFATPNY